MLRDIMPLYRQALLPGSAVGSPPSAAGTVALTSSTGRDSTCSASTPPFFLCYSRDLCLITEKSHTSAQPLALLAAELLPTAAISSQGKDGEGNVLYS